MKDKKDIRPVLIKFGVALALSFAGFLYSRMKNRRTKSPKPPRILCPSDIVNEVDEDSGRSGMRKTPSSRNIPLISADKHEDGYSPKVGVGNLAVVLSPSCRHNSGDKDEYLLPEFIDLVNEFDLNAIGAGVSPRKNLESPRSHAGTPRAGRNLEKNDYEQEIRHLRGMVRMLREREKHLEFQLLEFNGLKEQETAVMELQNRLKISNMETQLFTLKIESLQADNQRLQAQVSDQAKIASELDAARAKIKLLKKRLKYEAEQNKEHILTLQKRVSRLQEEELNASKNESDIKLKLQRLKDLEAESEDLRKSNLRLSLQNSELAHQLESTKILANSVLEDPEKEALIELSSKLKQENEDLAKEVERLHADRYNNTEELVYLRWINACLRYELRNFQPANGKTVARDLSKSLSPKSEEKAKQLILEYANTEEMGEKGINIMDFEYDRWSSPQTSHGEFDDSAVSPKTSNSRKIKIFKTLSRLIRGKDIRHHNHGSSACKAGEAEEYDSTPGSSSISTATDAASDQQFSRVESLSPDSSRQFSRNSADIDGRKNPKMEEPKEIGRRNSDVLFSNGHRRFMSGKISAGHLSPENQLEQGSFSSEKSDLLKFAEALKDYGNRSRTFHKKSVSLGSMGAFKRTTSQ